MYTVGIATKLLSSSHELATRSPSDINISHVRFKKKKKIRNRKLPHRHRYHRPVAHVHSFHMFHPAPHFRRYTHTYIQYAYTLYHWPPEGCWVAGWHGRRKLFAARDSAVAVYVIQLPWAPGVKTNHPLSTTTTLSVTYINDLCLPRPHPFPFNAVSYQGSLPPFGTCIICSTYVSYIHLIYARTRVLEKNNISAKYRVNWISSPLQPSPPPPDMKSQIHQG